MSCPGCLPGSGEKDQMIVSKRIEAKQLAIEQQRSIAIIEEAGEYYLCDAFLAYEKHLNVKEVVSYV